MTSSSTSRCRDVTRCFVCSKVYSSPRQLPCVHTFCLPCLERLGVDKRAGDVVECPLCGHQFRLSLHGFVGLPRNTFVEELAEIDKLAEETLSETQCDSCFETSTSAQSLNGVCVVSPAVVHCVHCVQNLCVSCCSRVCKMQSTNDDDVKTACHKVVDLSTQLRCTLRRDVRYCDRHSDEPVTSYCFDCRVALCSCCTRGRTHRIHRCVSLEKAASEFRHQFQRDSEMVADRCRQCVDEADRLERERRQFLDDIDHTASIVRDTEERIKRLVSEHANKLIQQLETMKTETLQKVDDIQADINRFMEVAESFVQYAETVQERGTEVDVTLSGNDLQARAAMLCQMPFTDTRKQLYRVPSVTFTPWHDLLELLSNHDDNVVGRIIPAARSQDGVQSTQFSLTPTVVRTLHEDARAVLGVAAILGHVFVARAESSEVEVYSAVTWALQRRLPVAGMRSPTDLAACESVGCVFICDWLGCRIHRVDVETSQRRAAVNMEDSAETLEDRKNWLNDHETGWWTTEKPWSLSLVEAQRRCTVLVICDQAAKLYEYTEFGSIVRQVCLASDLCNPRHAVLLDSGQFVVSLKDSICLVGADGRRILLNKTSPAAGRINVSGRLAVDDCGRLLVLDVDGRRVVQFDAELRQLRELVARDARLRYPARLCVDARRGRLYVADNELSQRTRLQTRFWGKTGRLIVYDIGASL